MQLTMKVAIAVLTLSSVPKVVYAASVPLAPSLNPLVRINVPIVALTHVTLFDGSEGPAKHDRTVVIDHGTIAAVGPTVSVAIPPGASVLDESGKTLLPGLIGMDEHLFYISAGGGAGHFLLGTEQAESAPRLYLAAGITTARTTGAIEPATDLALKRAIEQGTQAGPDLDVTGPYLDGRPNAILQNQSLTDPDDARQTVDYWSKRGATSFKAYMYITPTDLTAAIDEAHAHGAKLRFTDIATASDATVRFHCTGLSIWGRVA
jgi:predicted amidohydrolase YtcJ